MERREQRKITFIVKQMLYWFIIKQMFNNKPLVGSAGSCGWNRKEERGMTRLRNGHTGLNSSLYVIKKHNSGKSDFWRRGNGVLLFCQRFESARDILKRGLREMREGNIVTTVLKKNFSYVCWKVLFEYLEAARLMNRIWVILFLCFVSAPTENMFCSSRIECCSRSSSQSVSVGMNIGIGARSVAAVPTWMQQLERRTRGGASLLVIYLHDRVRCLEGFAAWLFSRF